MKIAVIDLGTNTFNLLIVEVHPDKSYHTIFQTKISVKLGEGGINQNVIVSTAFERGLNALVEHKATILQHQVEKIYAFGTSALRGASNAKDFIHEAKQLTDLDIEIISGDKEAEFIYYGVNDAVKMTEEKSLIIDIGGGSTEFIIANKNQIFWKQSFLLGAARLLEKFNPSDPVLDMEIEDVKKYLNQELQPLFEAVKRYPIHELIGSSGSFDSLAEMIAHKFYSPDILDDKTEYEFNMDDCEAIYNSILKSTKEDRLKMKGLVAMRVDMIVISSIIVHFVISSFQIKRMRLSSYSLKEGVLNRVLEQF